MNTGADIRGDRVELPFAGRRWFLGATLLEPGRGGIARVARMSARALAGAGAALKVHALHDTIPHPLAHLSPHPHRGSILRFALACHGAALSPGLFLYDAVGPARAHPRLPGIRRPYAVWIHGTEVWRSLSADRRRALANADLVLANSRFTLSRFEATHFTLENARICELATESDEAAPPPIAHDGLNVLVLGRIEAGDLYKGHQELLDAWPEVLARIPNARLRIAGDGSALPFIRSEIDRLGLADHVDLLGFVPEGEMDRLWRTSDVFAMPSRGEGFGLVYAEAMRYGVPVVASIHDAGGEVNAHGATGLNVDLDRPGDLANALIGLLADPRRRAAMGAAGRARWHERYRYAAFARRFRAALSGFPGSTKP